MIDTPKAVQGVRVTQRQVRRHFVVGRRPDNGADLQRNDTVHVSRNSLTVDKNVRSLGTGDPVLLHLECRREKIEVPRQDKVTGVQLNSSTLTL